METPTESTVKEPVQINHVITSVMEQIEVVSSSSPFIEANTIEGSLDEINNAHIVPVWVKDNETVISHGQLIESLLQAVELVYSGEAILKPNIRLSHPIKGRTPGARNKPASELREDEKTLYYERMAFIIEIPTIHTTIAGNRLNLTVGGVKAYNLDNLYNKSGADQHFKLFVGFQNKVCTNLSVTSDGYVSDLKVKDLAALQSAMYAMLQSFNAVQLSEQLQALGQYSLTEQQFATLVGRCRMYRYMPEAHKQGIPDLMFGESHINTICNDYYRDKSFCKSDDSSISLWNLYNLFTGANKSSYIDSFLDRSLNAYELSHTLLLALQYQTDCWYLT